MKKPLLIALALTLSACNAPEPSADSTTPVESPAPAADVVHDQGLPVDAMPEVDPATQEPCPYLDGQWLADTNGQRLISQGVDHRFDTPACQFWSYEQAPQATVIVRHMNTEEEAIAVVDWAAPIDSTEPAEEPEGWSGGRRGGPEGAIYAVQKGNVAVVVFSDQEQSFKAELIAKETITNLGL